MDNSPNIPGVTGDTYGVMIDLELGRVTISGEVMTETKQEANLFALAYRLGRDHKKLEIRRVLSL